MTDNQFGKYKLDKSICEALTMLKYTEPTPIQDKVIPLILEGRDVVGKSQTGSGKTAAFAIPICDQVDWLENLPQALILEPTRELAVQVQEEIFCIGRKKRIKVPAVFGGFPIDKQIQTLRQKSHIVVGTPGRVLDHLQRESLCGRQVKYLVIDEADLMLNMGFLEDVELIMEYLPKDRVTLLFSATTGDHVRELIDRHMKAPAMIEIESETETVEETIQEGYMVENEEKAEALIDILAQEDPGYCVIFCGTREMVHVLYRQMKKAGIRCGMLHGMLDQRERLKTIDDFRDGRFLFLISTDVAARGIDFDNITHVINYDFPMGNENYVHRIGRTGRNGKSGKAINFIQETEKRMLRSIEEYTGASITIRERPAGSELEEKKRMLLKKQKERLLTKERKGAVFNKEISRIQIGGGRRSKIRACDIVATICGIDGLEAEDIGIIDIRDSLTYVEILNGKGKDVLRVLPSMTLKGKVRKVR